MSVEEAREYRFPVSVKGVVVAEGRAVLLRNDRGEWELPGGRLEVGESPEECVEREIREELNLCVEAGPALGAWVYEVLPGEHVLIVTYGCLAEDFTGMRHSEEHEALGLFTPDELEHANAPEGYKSAVRVWSGRLINRSR